MERSRKDKWNGLPTFVPLLFYLKFFGQILVVLPLDLCSDCFIVNEIS